MQKFENDGKIIVYKTVKDYFNSNQIFNDVLTKLLIKIENKFDYMNLEKNLQNN